MDTMSSSFCDLNVSVNFQIQEKKNPYNSSILKLKQEASHVSSQKYVETFKNLFALYILNTHKSNLI